VGLELIKCVVESLSRGADPLVALHGSAQAALEYPACAEPILKVRKGCPDRCRGRLM